MLDGFKTKAKRVGRQYGLRNVSPQKGHNLCLGCWIWWATLLFCSTHPPSLMIYPSIFFFFFSLMKSSMISSRKRERQKRGIRNDSQVQAEKQGTSYCCLGVSYHSKHSFSWIMLSCPLPCLPPFSGDRTHFMKNLMCGFLRIRNISHL